MFIKSFLNKSSPVLTTTLKYFSTSHARLENHKCKLLVLGGGTGGCTLAAKFGKDLKKGEVIIVEPSETHYYQPLFTLIGGGIKKLEDSSKNMRDVLPSTAKWIKDKVVKFNPKGNAITVSNGDTVTYDFMLVALGLQLNYNQVPGLVEALSLPDSGVCSNYSPKYVNRTFEVLKKFESGNAIFTFPNTPVKCAGAPQKICYISEHYLRNVGKRDKANITYNTALSVIFSAKKYADALWTVCKKRNINVNLRTDLIEVKPKEKLAIFQNLDKPEQKTTMEYSMLHVTPPMSAPDILKKCSELVTKEGFVEVNKDTLQHVRFPNIFSVGDCSNLPTSKTAAAVAAQVGIAYKNMKSAMTGKQLTAKYDGYTSCPLITGYGTCIMAEFDYNLQPLETFPISQDKEMWLMYTLKKDFMPPLYWHLMLKGHWNGPEVLRNIMHLNFKRAR